MSSKAPQHCGSKRKSANETQKEEQKHDSTSDDQQLAKRICSEAEQRNNTTATSDSGTKKEPNQTPSASTAAPVAMIPRMHNVWDKSGRHFQIDRAEQTRFDEAGIYGDNVSDDAPQLNYPAGHAGLGVVAGFAADGAVFIWQQKEVGGDVYMSMNEDAKLPGKADDWELLGKAGMDCAELLISAPENLLRCRNELPVPGKFDTCKWCRAVYDVRPKVKCESCTRSNCTEHHCWPRARDGPHDPLLLRPDMS